jgi:hypothetical protein
VNVFFFNKWKKTSKPFFFVLKNIHQDAKFHQKRKPLHEFLYFYSLSFSIPKKMFPLAFRLVEAMETWIDMIIYFLYQTNGNNVLCNTSIHGIHKIQCKNLDLGLHTQKSTNFQSHNQIIDLSKL